MHLIDANVIIRFLTGDHEVLSKKAKDIFLQIENREIEVIVLDGVLMEAFFVLTKIYKLDKLDVIDDLKAILGLDGIVNQDKVILFETLNLMANKNIDFVDALICAKVKLQGFDSLSFDGDVNKKCKHS